MYRQSGVLASTDTRQSHYLSLRVASRAKSTKPRGDSYGCPCVGKTETHGNVAYNKETDQSGVFGELDSSKGVDGIINNSSSQSNCAHPYNDKGKAAWFYVDLESVHQIHNVTVYNTFNSGGIGIPDFTLYPDEKLQLQCTWKQSITLMQKKKLFTDSTSPVNKFALVCRIQIRRIFPT
ncbi:hypothetical protein CAPTEDRAFT_212626 [Capitella teleta]|uniref:Fucolectin tachylectin-4 pentraxin-1 domain-containing protein n=1 Tax=Capitella teleta TaxID=283909 RepID=R7V8J1_CAPTE|nr:hypothetical protein CAPTEDRAFT_212626 [Capitella teleta]|eukprot:ELU14879.1 hypothetical protein CAPTEDRAFT_212626 [Capitella teleta]